MSSAALQLLANNIAANTLTPLEQGALLQALAVIIPIFPAPDETSSAEGDTLSRIEWIAALYSIQSNGGAPVPPPGTVTEVDATLPLTSTTLGTVVTIGINPATDATTGSMSAADKTKIDTLPTGGALIVANAAALTAVPAAVLLNGYPAAVQTFGAMFALAPAGPAVDGRSILAASDGRVWLRGASLVTELALAQSDWFLDPAAGSDQATGLVGAPLKTFAEIVARYGASEPTLPYGQSVTVHLLTPQAPNTDGIFFGPRLSGGGQAVLVGTPIPLQAPFAGGAVTAKVKGGPGTLLQIAAMPAGVAAKQLVFNSTRNSYAFVDSMAGAVATMQQPIAAAGLTTPNVPAPVEDNTWATGDTLAVFDCPLANLAFWSPVAADENVGATRASVGWVQFVRIADSSGSGASLYGHVSRCVANVLSACRIDTRLNTTAPAVGRGGGSGCYIIGCTMAGGLVQVESGQCLFFGGACINALAVTSGFAQLQGDLIVHNAISTVGGGVFATAVYCTTGLNTAGGVIELLAAGAVWGPAGAQAFPGGVFYNASGTTWVLAWLGSGPFLLGAVTTGSAYVGAGVMTDGITITPTTIDAGGAGGPGLFNPKTGARFCNAN